MMSARFTSTALLLSSLVGVVTSLCEFGGDICNWNTRGFESTHVQDASNTTALVSNIPYSYIQSEMYANVTTPHCELKIEYQSNHTDLLLHYVEVYLSHPDSLPEQLEKARLTYMNSTMNTTLISVLSSTNGSGWMSESIALGRTVHPFKLVLSVRQEVTDEHLYVAVKSLTFNDCDPDLIIPRHQGCTISNSTLCPGWEIKNQKEDQRFYWTPTDDYIRLSQYIPHTLVTALESPIYPYNYGSQQCTLSLSYSIAGFLEKYIVPSVYVKAYHRYYGTKNDERYYNDPINFGVKDTKGWRNATFNISMSSSFNSQDGNHEGFYVRLDVYSNPSASKNGIVKVKDLQFSRDCFPPPSEKSPEVFSQQADYLFAEKLLVAERKSTYTFLPCLATGRTGPTHDQCKIKYRDSKPFVNVTIDDERMPGVQIWNVPKDDEYDIVLFGATGGLGVESLETGFIIRGFHYLQSTMKSQISLVIWPQRLHVRLKLYDTDRLYIIAGQAGGMACEKNSLNNNPGCKKSDNNSSFDQSRYGGGGGGGGASIAVLERNDTYTVLAIAGGGGGMGRVDIPLDFDYESVLRNECSADDCPNNTFIRPGIGGSYNTAQRLHNQDGHSLHLPFTAESLLGGVGCYEYRDEWNTEGGFGGGGGGCTAGGGGAGYKGGQVSKMDNPDLPGMGGTYYYDQDLVELITFDKSDPYHIYHPHGSVDVNPVPPQCPCPADTNCRWNNTDYVHFSCLCDGLWVPGEDILQYPELCGGASSNLTLVVSACVGAVVTTILIAIAIIKLCHMREQKRKLQIRPNKEVVHLGFNHIYYDVKMPAVIQEERLQIVSHLGEGKFSQVFEARLALSDAWNAREITVAVKKPAANSNTEQAREEFIREAQTINSFDHPNIMKILGICYYADRSIGIVMDVLKGGDLRTFLKERKPSPSLKTEENLSHWDLLRIAGEISSACKYLEEMKFIHRDIAARNVLLTEKGDKRIAKISDFGLSRDVIDGDYWSRSRPTAVPVRWYPPEAVHTYRQSSKSDVWSYGILLWEIFTFGEYPYPGKDHAEVASFITQGGTMDPPSDSPPIVADIMRKCWIYDPSERPYFSFIYLQLSRYLETQGPQQKLTNTSAILPKPVRKMLRSSVTSSSSSGFEEALESPTSLSAMPLLGTANTGSSDQGFSEGFSIMVHEQSVSSFDV